MKITLTANITTASIYQSKQEANVGESVTIYARPLPNYSFSYWSDGSRDNPRNITVSTDIELSAIYIKERESNAIYQYRGFIKEQIDLTSKPKAFVTVRSFSVTEDLLTTSKSTFNVLTMPDNINIGDVFVLYDPKGKTVYNGVINSISDLTIECNQMISFYKGTWIYNVRPSASLEQEIALLLGDYAQGKMYKSTYIDRSVARRLGGITIRYEAGTTVHLPTDLDDKENEKMTSQDMEKFLYSLYKDYEIMLVFEINYEGQNYVTIKKSTYDSIKVGNNNRAITNMLPVQTVEETNRLIIYSKDKEYRKTYIATINNEIVEEPTTLVGRFNITNTKIVYSDDEFADLIASNLPNTMYNHKITFSLLLKNFLYDFDDFKLGMEMEIFYGDEYYKSIYTSYKMAKDENVNVSTVEITCGLVRTALTKKLSLGVVS